MGCVTPFLFPERGGGFELCASAPEGFNSRAKYCTRQAANEVLLLPRILVPVRCGLTSVTAASFLGPGKNEIIKNNDNNN